MNKTIIVAIAIVATVALQGISTLHKKEIEEIEQSYQEEPTKELSLFLEGEYQPLVIVANNDTTVFEIRYDGTLYAKLDGEFKEVDTIKELSIAFANSITSICEQ